jgi:RNA polymerase sigma factor (sigma-70 family)
MDNTSCEILKSLVLIYQETKEPLIFAKILRRIDRLVISVVYKCKLKYYQLHKVQFSDLYQAAIIGIYRGIETAKEKESCDIIQARLISYMILEIKSEYVTKTKKLSSLEKNKFIPGESVYNHLQIQNSLDFINKLVVSGQVDKKGFELVKLRYLDGMKVKDIAEFLNSTSPFVSQKIQDTLAQIRVAFRLQGIAEDY